MRIDLALQGDRIRIREYCRHCHILSLDVIVSTCNPECDCKDTSDVELFA